MYDKNEILLYSPKFKKYYNAIQIRPDNRKEVLEFIEKYEERKTREYHEKELDEKLGYWLVFGKYFGQVVYKDHVRNDGFFKWVIMDTCINKRCIMAKYIKKPITIEASRWFKNGDHEHVQPFTNTSRRLVNKCEQCDEMLKNHGQIDTLEGVHIVCPGDWIITGIKGEHYPCKPNIFEASYDKC